MMERRCLPATVVLLAMLLSWGGPAAGHRHCRKTKQVAKPVEPKSCSSQKGSSSLAVSVVFAQCQGDVVLAAQSLAQAAVSGCGDAYAAGVGVSIANLAAVGTDGLVDVLSSAFGGAISVSQTIGDAAAVSQGIAIAFASELPSDISATKFLADVAYSIAEVAGSAGCPRATAISIAFYNGLTLAAPGAAPLFAAEIGRQVSKCKQLVKLAALSALTAATDPKGTAKLARLVARVPGGRGRGRCGQPLFSPGVDRQVQSSSLAIAIANVTCPAAGSAQVAAIAIATAAKDDRSVASSAIAGVLTAGVDVSASFLEAAYLAAPQRKVAVQAFAAAIVGVDAAAQELLIGNIATALTTIAANMGCDNAIDILGFIQGTSAGVDPAMAVPAVSPVQLQQLCGAVATCPAACAPLMR